MNNEEKILSMLEMLVVGQQTTNQRLDNLEHHFDNLEHRFDNLEQEVKRINHTVVRIESEHQQFRNETLQRFDNLEQKVNEINHTVIRIENEHGKKLDVLFDGYQLLYDISIRVRDDVSKLQYIQEDQDTHIKYLNSRLKYLNAHKNAKQSY